MRIIITGSPGTGKSAIARALSERTGLPLIDIKRVARERGLVGKSHEVDLKKLAAALRPPTKKKDFIAEGHLACEIRLPADFVFVLRTAPRVLRRRLARRGYNKKKLEENLVSEMLDYCVQRAEIVYRRMPLELDTSQKSVSACVGAILRAMKQKKKKLDTVDYSSDLKRHLKVR
ncbi:dephospho-CoA kinase [Candidatus Micrarchaeota archaeon]|nr:dephospho-CoA kinase [Candidatus Micrarchaeota archaeon]